jgi:hypothetical protein
MLLNLSVSFCVFSQRNFSWPARQKFAAAALVICWSLTYSRPAVADVPPLLSVSYKNQSVVISWPQEYRGAQLEQTLDLGSTWTDVNGSLSTNQITLPASGFRKFFRLRWTTNGIPMLGLVARYDLNGDANDSVGGHHGTIHNAVPTSNRFTNGTSAYSFNGTNAYIEIPDDDVFSISTTGEFSISAWMRPGTSTFPMAEGHWVYWLSKVESGNHCDPNTGSQDEWAFRMYNEDSGETEPAANTCYPGSPAGRPNWVSIYAFNLCDPDGSNYGAGSRTYCSPATIGAWTHYVATFKYTGTGTTNGIIQLYKNGQLIDHDPFFYNTTPIIPANGKALVRFGKGSGNYFFKGGIDNVLFYRRVLTPQEVLNLFTDQTR